MIFPIAIASAGPCNPGAVFLLLLAWPPFLVSYIAKKWKLNYKEELSLATNILRVLMDAFLEIIYPIEIGFLMAGIIYIGTKRLEFAAYVYFVATLIVLWLVLLIKCGIECVSTIVRKHVSKRYTRNIHTETENTHTKSKISKIVKAYAIAFSVLVVVALILGALIYILILQVICSLTY